MTDSVCAGGAETVIGLILRGQLQFEVEDGGGSGKNGYRLLDGGEAGVRNGDGVFGERDGVEVKLAVRIGLRRFG